jgi:hypothetical protein
LNAATAALRPDDLAEPSCPQPRPCLRISISRKPQPVDRSDTRPLPLLLFKTENFRSRRFFHRPSITRASSCHRLQNRCTNDGSTRTWSVSSSPPSFPTNQTILIPPTQLSISLSVTIPSVSHQTKPYSPSHPALSASGLQ